MCFPSLELNGSKTARLSGNLNMTFPGVQNQTLMQALKNVAFSAGSACATDKGMGSHVLRAIGLTPNQMNSTIRVGLGRFNTQEEVNYFIDRVLTELGTQVKVKEMGLFQDPELRKAWRIKEDAYSDS